MKDAVFRQDWNAARLLRFALPTVAMMLFMGLYTVVDTVFVARLVNTDALSAVNIVCPAVNVAVGLGTMLAAGGNAVVSRKMGAGETQAAREDFTLLTLAAAVAGLALALPGILCIDRLTYALGASGRLFPYCKAYLWTLLWFFPANLLQTLFAALFVTAGRPGLGLGLSLAAGAANIALDYLFIVPCGLGVQGAALGTGCGYLIPAAAGTAYFLRCGGTLSFTKPRLRWGVLGESCWNGSSEMAGQLASAVTTFLLNAAMLERLGEDGVAAATILIYAQFLLHTLFLGFSMGVAPVIGFCHGAGCRVQQRRVFRSSLRFIAAASAAVFAASRLGGRFLVRLFAAETTAVYQIAAEGLAVFSYSFLFCGMNLFTSAAFTALSNGKVSAILSFLRTFVLLAGGILLLPRIWGGTGVWLAAPLAEGILFWISLACLLRCWNG